jgi:hypothetical protein
MTVPLSGVQKFPRQVGGMFGGPRGRIMEGGAYNTISGIGTPNNGYNGDGWYWNQYPAVIAGLSGYSAPSTETGAPTNTYVDNNETKVGGGTVGADSDAGETPATTTGMSQGGTAA